MPMPTPPNNAKSYLDYDWVEEVAETLENDLRSARIALTYSKFAEALDDLMFKAASVRNSLGRAYKVETCDANWFHFATWAVLTVGRNISNTRAPQRLNLLPNVWRSRLAPIVIHARAEDRQRIGRSLAWAQRSIFVTVSYALLDELANAGVTPVNGTRLAGRVENLCVSRQSSRQGRGSWAVLAVGAKAKQKEKDDAVRYYDLTRKAFSHYGVIASTPLLTAEQKSRLMLLANVMVTAVEQKLIDKGVAAVVETVPDRAFHVLEGRIGQFADRALQVPRQLTAFVAPVRLMPVRDVATAAWARLLADQLFVMALPGETLRVGRDIPPFDPRRPYYSAALRDLRPDVPIAYGDAVLDSAMDELRRLMFRFDRTRGDGRGSGAQDWRNYDSRMNWAITLLRSRQHDPSLYWPPFATADAERMIAGELPLRGGDPIELEVLPPLDNGGPL